MSNEKQSTLDIRRTTEFSLRIIEVMKKIGKGYIKKVLYLVTSQN